MQDNIKVGTNQVMSRLTSVSNGIINLNSLDLDPPGVLNFSPKRSVFGGFWGLKFQTLGGFREASFLAELQRFKDVLKYHHPPQKKS